MMRILSLLALLVALTLSGCCLGHYARHHRPACDKAANCDFKAPPCDTVPCKTATPCGKPCCKAAVPDSKPVDTTK